MLFLKQIKLFCKSTPALFVITKGEAVKVRGLIELY